MHCLKIREINHEKWFFKKQFHLHCVELMESSKHMTIGSVRLITNDTLNSLPLFFHEFLCFYSIQTIWLFWHFLKYFDYIRFRKSKQAAILEFSHWYLVFGWSNGKDNIYHLGQSSWKSLFGSLQWHKIGHMKALHHEAQQGCHCNTKGELFLLFQNIFLSDMHVKIYKQNCISN